MINVLKINCGLLPSSMEPLEFPQLSPGSTTEAFQDDEVSFYFKLRVLFFFILLHLYFNYEKNKSSLLKRIFTFEDIFFGNLPLVLARCHFIS